MFVHRLFNKKNKAKTVPDDKQNARTHTSVNQELYITGSARGAGHAGILEKKIVPLDMQLGTTVTKSITQVACGSSFCMFKTADNCVYVFGTIAGVSYTKPHRYSHLDGKIKFISAKSNECFIVTGTNTPYYNLLDRDVFVMGNNVYKQCGVDVLGAIRTPTKIEHFSGMSVVDISCGFGHNMFLTNDGQVWVSGSNSLGQKGRNDPHNTGNYSTPENPAQELLKNYRVKSIHAGYAHNVVLTTTGEAIGWGNNHSFQINDLGLYVYGPVLMDGITTFGSILECTCSQYCSVFLTISSNVVIRGTLGQKKYSTASLLKFSEPIITISAGENSLFALTNSGELHGIINERAGTNSFSLGRVENHMSVKIVAAMEYAVLHYKCDLTNPFPFLYDMDKNRSLAMLSCEC